MLAVKFVPISSTRVEKFPLVNDDGDDEKIFATMNNLIHLSAAETTYVDGAFYTPPSLFIQLYTLLYASRSKWDYVPISVWTSTQKSD